MGITLNEVLEGVDALLSKVIDYFLTCRNASDLRRSEVYSKITELKDLLVRINDD